MLTLGTIRMLPRGNIILPPDNILVVPHDNIPMMPRVNTLLCDKMVGWWVLPMPSLHHMYTHTHTPKYASYTPPNIQIHVFIYKNYTSLNPRPHGGIQMP